MTIKKLLQAIIEYDKDPSYPKNKEDIDLFKKATRKLQRHKRYLEMRKLLEELEERETDIYIVSHAKSGTTLTQMILYQMITDGDMNFEHLNDVSPWPAWSYSRRLAIKEPPTPRRLLKSHDPYSLMSQIKQGKFLFLVRNPLDVMNSDYHHCRDYYQLTEPYEEWVAEKLEFWYTYNEAWLSNKSGLDILYLNYEDTINDKLKQIHRIANFIDFELTDGVEKRILERTSLQFMKRYEEKFGEQPNKKKVYNNFIRNGKTGEGIKRASETIKLKNEELSEKFCKTHLITKRYFN